MSDNPIPPEVAAEIIAAIKRGDAIVCYTKCWGCTFGQCTDAHDAGIARRQATPATAAAGSAEREATS